MSLTKVSYSMIDSAPLSVIDYGADQSGLVNSSAAFNAAILECALAGGGTVTMPYGTYLLQNTVFLPAYVTLDLGGSIIEGPGVGSATNLFESGYLSGGAVISNINVALTYVIRGSIRNGFIKNCGKALAMERLIDGCEIRDLQFENCTYAVWSNDSYYPRFINLFSRGAAAGATNAAFYFATYVNVNAIESVFVADRVLGMEIAVNGNCLTLYNCSAEGCTDGIKVTGNLYPIKFDTCYFEAIPGVALSFNGGGVAEVNNCWFNTSGTGIYAGPNLSINVDDNNYFLNTPQTVVIDNDFTITGRVQFRPVLIANNGYPINPVGATIKKRMALDYDNIIFNSATGDALIRSKVHDTTLIAFEHEGDAGVGFPNTIPFCISTFASSATSTLFIDTRIVYRDLTGIIGYNIKVGDETSVTFHMYGFVFGDVAQELGSSGKTVVASNNAGFLRLSISTFNNTTGASLINGVIRHV